MAEPHRVACVGASLTFGLGLANRREESYPAVLGRMLAERYGEEAYAVRNFGFSGATISRTGNEPYWDTPSFLAATRHKPRTTIVMLGTNDAQHANAAARDSLARDLADLVEHFREVGEEVLVGQPPPAFPPVPEIDFDALENVVRPAIARVAAELDAPLVDFLTPLADAREEFPDGLHPTAAAARRIAEIAYRALAPGSIGLTLS